MSKAKTKRYLVYRITTFDNKAACIINVAPQQKWTYLIYGNTAYLHRKGIGLNIPKEDFEKNWSVIE